MPLSRRNAVALLIVAAILLSTGGVFIKMITWKAPAILGGRALVALIVFLIYLRPKRLDITRVRMFGAAGYMFAQLLFILATKMTTAANAIFLQYTMPVYVILLGYWVLQERPQKADWISLAFILPGMILFFADDLRFDGFLGNILAIVSGVAMAVIVVCMRLDRDASPGHTLLLGNAAASLIGLPFLIAEPFDLWNVLYILYLGTFQLGLAFVIYSIAIRYIQALESTLILTLEPILNPLWVFLVIQEKPGGMALWGAAVVIAAVLGRALVGMRQR